MGKRFPHVLLVTRTSDPSDPKETYLSNWETERAFFDANDSDGELVAVYRLERVERLTITKTTTPVNLLATPRKPRAAKKRKGARRR